MLEFFSSVGIVHHEFKPEGQKMTKEMPINVCHCLNNSIKQKIEKKYEQLGSFVLECPSRPIYVGQAVPNTVQYDYSQAFTIFFRLGLANFYTFPCVKLTL